MCRQCRPRAPPKANRRLGRVLSPAWLVVMALLVTACGSPALSPSPPPATTPSMNSDPAESVDSSRRANVESGTDPVQNLRFERISIAQGLSHSTVNCILQDSKGFMWFGTEDGFNKYDGYSFSVYKHDPDDPHSLSHNQIKSLHQDQFGTLWAGAVDRLGDDWHLGVRHSQGIECVKQHETPERI